MALLTAEKSAAVAVAFPETRSSPVEALIREVRQRARRRRLITGGVVVVAALVIAGSIVTVGGNGPETPVPIARFHGSASRGVDPITTAVFNITRRDVTVLRWSDPSPQTKAANIRPSEQAGEMTVEVIDAANGVLVNTGAIPGVLLGLLPLSRQVVENGVEDADPTTGSVGLTLAPGRYRLLVTATGPWTIDLFRASASSTVAAPHTWTGIGPAVVGPFTGGSSLQLKAKDLGSSRVVGLGTEGEPAFDAEVFSATTGRALAVALEVTTPYSGRAPSVGGLPGGPYYLGIFAWGRWSITVTSPGP